VSLRHFFRFRNNSDKFAEVKATKSLSSTISATRLSRLKPELEGERDKKVQVIFALRDVVQPGKVGDAAHEKRCTA